VLIDTSQVRTSSILLTQNTLEKWDVLDRVGLEPLKGEVVAVGRQRGRVPMPQVGQTLALKRGGLTVEHNDFDIPTVGKMVPKGFALRIYGVGEEWTDGVHGRME